MNPQIAHPVRFVVVVGLTLGALQTGHFPIGGLLMAALLTAMYFLPTAIAHQRHHHQTSSIAVINTLLGWTFIGWVVALAMACSAVTAPVTASPTAPEGHPGW